MVQVHVEVRKLVNVGGDWRYRRIGLVDSYLSLDVIVRYNAVGSWTLQLPPQRPQAALLTPGTGVVIWLDGMSKPVLSGPLRTIQRDWSEDDAGPGSVTLPGVCDNTILAERLCWPSPDQGFTQPSGGAGYRQPAAYWGTNAPYSAARMIHELAYMNFGDGAWTPRRARGFYHVAPAGWPGRSHHSDDRVQAPLRNDPGGAPGSGGSRPPMARDGYRSASAGSGTPPPRRSSSTYRPDQSPDGKVGQAALTALITYLHSHVKPAA